MESLHIIVLAAGKGKRMLSKLPKVLHRLNGIPLITYVVNMAESLSPDTIWVVLGYMAEEVNKAIVNHKVNIAYQMEQLGTAHAVMQVMDKLSDKKEDDNILILYGDVPLITRPTLIRLIYKHNTAKAEITILTAMIDDPYGYGRIIRGHNGVIMEIREERDADESIKKIKEINSGVYCFKKGFLANALKGIKDVNSQGEYYLTDVIQYGFKNGYNIADISSESPEEILGVNTIDDLKRLENAKQ